MNRRWVMGIVLLIVLIVGTVALGGYAYSIGMMQGLAQSGRLLAPSGGDAPAPYYASPSFYRPFGFGFGAFGCLLPLLFFFLVFALVRGIFWGGRWGWHGHRGMHGMTENGVPPMLEEWHRKMHEPKL
jgi:hypothetical protein